ncbi:hypothetical protein CBR_g1004 [Chara braunii]|uniref:Uncharacterized protein n=1 Tax=Chara braunii TaxID=69332 RepID=A0A388KCV7_CHABU|nr:hypothetical protein CBR_g1004 [Chara braunii]|eukprot:GBG67885.1 hypothetical protein CBR_g1004 [Chara braunii]
MQKITSSMSGMSSSFVSMFKPKPNPQQQLREWQRKLRNEQRNIERQIREISRDGVGVQKEIKIAAKRGDMQSAKVLARELVRARKVISRLHENKAQLNSISLKLGESVATARVVGHLQKSTEVMQLVNGLLKAPEIAKTMQEMSKEMMKAGIMEEMVEDTMESVLDNDDIEEETEEEVSKLLDELAVEVDVLPEAATKLPASERQRVKAKTRLAEQHPADLSYRSARGADGMKVQAKHIKRKRLSWWRGGGGGGGGGGGKNGEWRMGGAGR